MVKILIVVVYMLFPFYLFSQKDTSCYKLGVEMVTAIESWPEFRGDIAAFIRKQILYPVSAIRDSIEGKVYVTFYVDSVGNTYQHVILKGIRIDIDEEALRVARLIKFNNPAMQRGKPVIVRYYIPIEFKLPRHEEFQ